MSWEQINNDIAFTAFFTAAKVGKTGLADVTVDVYRNGTLIVGDDDAVEEGGGLYSYVLVSASVTTPGRYIAVFKTADGTVDQQHVPSLMLAGLAGVENLDAPVSTAPGLVWDELMASHLVIDSFGEYIGQIEPLVIAASLLNTDVTAYTLADSVGEKLNAIDTVVTLLSTTDVTVIAPLSADGSEISVVRGDDYLAAQTRQLTFSSAAWPDITAADPIVLTIRRRKEAFGTGSDPVLMVRSDVLASRDGGGSPQVVVFELTSDIGNLAVPNVGDTNALLVGTASGKFDIEATLATGEIITLVTGTVNVVEDQTRP